MDPLLEQFLQEARENLAFIDQNVENIGGDDPELLNAVFRAAHTLKGGSGIVGFESVKEITHHAEDLLDMLRAGKVDFKQEMVEVLYNAFDEVLNLIEAAEETQEIVDADEETVAGIITELNELMGKGDSVEQNWECPFVLGNNTARIVNLPLNFLKSHNREIPFHLSELDESTIEEEHLYAIVFDVDESCMIFGNDPLYALSLLGDTLLGIHSCMSQESAKTVLSGFDDEDDLLLKIELTAFVHANYETIEDALFNFIDELPIYRLDIATLLQINRGETGHQLKVMKEFISESTALLSSGDKEGLRNAIEKSLQLVGNETIQHFQLQRLSQLIRVIRDDELKELSPFIASLENGIAFDGSNVVTATMPEADEEVPTEVPETVIPQKVEITEKTQSMLTRMLEQQLLSLQTTQTDDAINRVKAFMEHLRPYLPQMPSDLENRAQLTAFISAELNLEASVEEVEDEIEREELLALHEEEQGSVTAPKVVTPRPKEEAKKNVIGKTVKIEQESIDQMMNIVGELLVAKNSLPYLAQSIDEMNSDMISRAIMEKYTFINRLSEQLQDLIMSMRMLPISYVFDRYPKLVRDISKKMGKKVKLEMNGGDTKLDKNMIEMLADPMIHIMRNSLDHGIEMPDVREKKGKTPEGNVTLKAYPQSDKIIIEIKDDGAGINVEKVIQKVLEKELLTLDQIDALSDDEKAELVLLPGLSTADEISEYSGRGVGMDVVKKSIEGFGGSINIKTFPNLGTTITLMIPLSLAVSSLLHVSMSGVNYGFPMDSVSETVKIDREDIEYLHNEPFVYIREEVIPLLFIKSMLNEDELEGQQLPIVVLNIKGNLLAVVVNQLLGQLDVVQKPLEGVMENHPIFSGTSLLGNGQIIMAIDPLGLLQIAHELKTDEQKVS